MIMIDDDWSNDWLNNKFSELRNDIKIIFSNNK